MEQVKHIKNISIENFKCFDHFSVEGFGMYNIILGDNNVGKSSFLESLIFDENLSESISNLQGILEFKKISADDSIYKVNPLKFFLNKKFDKEYIKVKIFYFNEIGFTALFETQKVENLDISERKNLDQFVIFGSNDKELLKITKNNSIQYRSFQVQNNVEGFTNIVPFIPANMYYSDDLVSFYSENFTDNRNIKKTLIAHLRSLIPNLIDIEISMNYMENIPVVGFWLDNVESLLPLPMFGDGTIRLFRLIMEIVSCKNKYLCIDEIDTGIHYSRYKDFSRIVLKTASENNVQLFISTHNNEFLKSFKEVLEEKDFVNFQNDTKSFTLKKLPNGDIKAYRYDFEEFEFAIEQENELR